MSLLLDNLHQYLKWYGWLILYSVRDCTWRQARSLFATNFNVVHKLLALAHRRSTPCGTAL